MSKVRRCADDHPITISQIETLAGQNTVLHVPELWLYDQTLKIYILRDSDYVESQLSPIFGDIPICDVIPQFLEISLSEGRSKAMKAFRLWMQENLSR